MTISTDFKCNDHGDGHTRIEARNPYLTTLIGLPPKCFRFSQPNRHNGLLARFEPLCADRRERDILLAPPAAEQQRQQLIQDFRSLQQVEGAMRFGAGAESVWLELQKANRCLLDDNPPDQVAGYLSRMPFSVLRIAMLFEVATTGGLEISADSLQLAGRMAEHCRAGYMKFLGDLTKTDAQRLEDRIVAALRRTGDRAGHSPLLKSVTRHGEWTTADFKAALDSLLERQCIRFVHNPATRFADVLLIQNSGTLTDNRGYLGYEAGSSNSSVLVTGNGSVWNNSSTLLIGWSGSHNSLTISNGGQVINFGPGGYYSGIGGNSNSNLVEVTGTGSVWKCYSDTLYVGNNGASNSLVIRNGGNVVGNGGGVGAGFSGSNNSVLVTDSGSVWSNLGVSVGSAGWGNRLVISNGGKVFSTGSGRVGASDFMKLGSNTVLVTGSGSVWSNGGDWQVGGYMWGNSLVVNGGGLLFNINGYVGSYPNSSSNNSMLVSDVGSVWTNLGDVHIGDGSVRNSLTVSNGAKVFNGYGYLGYGYISSSNNSALVTGSGSLWTNRNDLYVGRQSGGNSLTILSSGAVHSLFGYIGNDTTAASNSVVVAGTGSVWSIVNYMYVGNSGPGNSLVISNGGRVITGHNDSHLGYNASSSNNTVIVTGPGSVLSNGYGNSISIGYSGASNGLVISGGGKVLNNSSTIGYSSSASNNSVLVTDSGSVWSNRLALFIGWSGSRNSLVISNGGLVVSGIGYLGSNNLLASNNSVVVTGTGSVWNISGALRIGNASSGNSLTIIGGGAVNCGFARVGSGGNRNTALVTGSGSVWSNTGDLSIGVSGSGHSLVISNNGRVVNSTGYVGNNSNSNTVRVADAGVWQNDDLHVGETGSSNSLVVAGGTVFATNLVIGFNSSTCDNWVQLYSGSVYVTNATGDATLEVRYGKFILNGGVLQADRLVMTNACGLFVRNGGTLTVGTLVLRPDLDADGDGIPNVWEQTYGLDPLNAADASADDDGDGMFNLQEFLAGTDPTNGASAFRIIRIAREGNDVRVTWATAGGRTNVLQAASNLLGVYFNVSPNIVIAGVGDVVTNYLDTGAATNTTSRFYRVATSATSIQDTNAPMLAITSPADNTYITNSTITVTGTSADASGVAGVTVNDIAASSTNGYSNWVAVVSGLADGTNVLTVIAGDNAAPANRATGTVRVICATDSFDGNGDGLPDGWQIEYFGAVNVPGSGPSDDPDGDGQHNLQEYLAGTDPTNSASAFRIISVAPSGSDLLVTWMMGSGRANALQATAGDASGGYNTDNFTDIFIVTNSVGTTTNYLDTGATTNVCSRYYRVRLVPAAAVAQAGNCVCNLGYPYPSSNPRTSVNFNESEVLAAHTTNYVGSGAIKLWYNDEHAMTLGIRQVVVDGVVSNYPVSPLTSVPDAVMPVQVGSMELTGDQAAIDPVGRPEWPAMFLSDVTTDTANRDGDWQYGGTPIPPTAVFGTWKAAVKMVTTDGKGGSTEDVIPDYDPAKNSWDLGPGSDPPPAKTGGYRNEGYGAEVRWDVDDLLARGVIQHGHIYRVQFMVHDGDQHQSGGDCGEGCAIIAVDESCSGGLID